MLGLISSENPIELSNGYLPNNKFLGLSKFKAFFLRTSPAHKINNLVCISSDLLPFVSLQYAFLSGALHRKYKNYWLYTSYTDISCLGQV